MKKMFLALSLFTAGLMLPGSSHATCNVKGQVVRLTDSATTSYAYIKTSSLSSVYYFTSVGDSDLRDALRACKVSGQVCLVIGNAGACPTTGTGRNMGGTITVYHNP